jgi:hypothetical protein
MERKNPELLPNETERTLHNWPKLRFDLFLFLPTQAVHFPKLQRKTFSPLRLRAGDVIRLRDDGVFTP